MENGRGRVPDASSCAFFFREKSHWEFPVYLAKSRKYISLPLVIRYNDCPFCLFFGMDVRVLAQCTGIRHFVFGAICL